MGFQRILKNVPLPLDTSFKPIYDNMDKINDVINDEKSIIITYCMQDHTNDDISQVLKYIKNHFTLYINFLEEREKLELQEKANTDDDEIWFYGWEFVNSNDYKVEDDDSDFFASKIQELLILAKVVKTPDYLENREGFWNKINDIDDCLDLSFTIQENMTRKFIVFYKDYDITYKNTTDDITSDNMKQE